MYFFFHVFTGATLGLLIGDILRDRRWVLLCTFGAVLPDLIDKPLGLFFFQDSIGYGRIFGHALLAALVLLALGVMVWKWLKSPVVMGVAVGVVSHQVLDLMWREPQNWLYPFYGPFHGDLNAEFFSVLAIRELTNPFEILVALLLFVGVLLVVYRDDILKIFARHTTVWKWLMIAAAIVLCGLSVVCGSIGFLMGEGIRKQTKLLHDWFGWDRLVPAGRIHHRGCHLPAGRLPVLAVAPESTENCGMIRKHVANALYGSLKKYPRLTTGMACHRVGRHKTPCERKLFFMKKRNTLRYSLLDPHHGRSFLHTRSVPPASSGAPEGTILWDRSGIFSGNYRFRSSITGACPGPEYPGTHQQPDNHRHAVLQSGKFNLFVGCI